MNKQKSQSGFAHLMIVVIILSLALVGTLGYVFYQNFVQKKDTSLNTADTKKGAVDTNKAMTYKTYTDSVYNATFQYPENWSVGTVEAYPSDDPHHNRFLDIKNEDSVIVAKLILGLSGIGGTCADDNGVPIMTKLTVIDSSVSSIKATKPVAASFILVKADDKSGYYATYGLTDEYTNQGDYQACMFYNLFDSGLKDNNGYGYLISFGSNFSGDRGKYFSSTEDASAYVASSEYKEIKKMMLSLSY